ncbi:MAG: glycoside hydrolase family 3 C-terminal domain-containing protein [Clostridia bacterium]|nr:glycoside hydrolase family 3 C-terminal domain-containing protein [Clostridia bacterium]
MLKWTRMKYYPCKPLGEDGRCVTGSKEHIEFARRLAGEGMVLLKNEYKTLPLKKGAKIAIFGIAQIDYVTGGGGSGKVYSEYDRNIYDGLKIKEEEGKIEIFRKLSDYYESTFEKGGEQDWLDPLKINFSPGSAIEKEIPSDLLAEARDFTDTAIITISRYSREAKDRSQEKGDFYLNDLEMRMVETVCKNFDKVIAVLNVGGVIDTDWFRDNDKIQSSLLAWNPGMEGGLAVADILCGDVNPSGKLTDTFAKTFADYPSADTFNESDMYLKYYEDIYVGYRYFETIKGAAERVNYPFGFGLSYTDFELSDIKVKEENGQIIAEATVKNTGKVAGREVVQLYYSAPQGKLGKPSRELAAFKKTKLLAPNESEKIELTFAIRDMASYDDTGKCEKSAYLLEKGEYTFHIGNSVRNTVVADYKYIVNDEFVIVEKLTEQMTPYNLEKRLLADGSYEEIARSERKRRNIEYRPKDAIPASFEKGKIMLSDVADGKATLDEFIAQLDEYYMADLLGGRPNRGVAITSGIGGESENDKYGVPCAMTCDGPAGIRITPDKGVSTTAFPCATLVACTWDTDLMYEMGKIGAMEAKENNLMIWLSPGMNIHRNPLCGRNFEYYSEDPLLTGKMAAANVRGVQSQNIAATPKHFAANSKETNRRECDSIVSERALREIYLKGFEICVKEASPRCLMTSYNPINGERASENYDMLTKILREEWGFEGLVMTDWRTYSYHGNEIVAGNDVRMPRGYHDSALQLAYTGRMYELQQSVKRVLKLLLDFE